MRFNAFILVLFFSCKSYCQMLYTIAGKGSIGFSGDGGPAIEAEFSGLGTIALDSAGNLYIVDNARIRKINKMTGIITTVAGNGIAGSIGDGGLATSARISPHEIAIDAPGNLYFSEAFNHKIRKVSATTGIISTIAGNGIAGFLGDGGPATSARINLPTNLVVDALGDLYFSDCNNHRVRKISNGIITTVVGGGTDFQDSIMPTSAVIWNPRGLAFDKLGNLFLCEGGGAAMHIQKVNFNTGIITRFAGYGNLGNGQQAIDAGLSYLYNITFDNLNNLFIAEEESIRKISSMTSIISTVGGGVGYFQDSVLATQSYIGPRGLVCDKAGNLIFSDPNRYRIRVIRALNKPTIIKQANNDTACLNAKLEIIDSSALSHVWQAKINNSWHNLMNDNQYSGTNTKELIINNVDTSVTSREFRCFIGGFQSDTFTSIVKIIQGSIIANFTVNESKQCINNNNFVISDLSISNSGKINRTWTGCGIQDTASIYSFKLNQVGKCYVTLSVNTDKGCSGSFYRSIEIADKPKADFGVNNNTQCINQNLFIFNDTSNTVKRVWNFGRSLTDTATAKLVNIRYTTPSIYNIQLVAIDSFGCMDTIMKFIKVLNKPDAGTIYGQNNALQANIPYNYFVNQQTNVNYQWLIINGAIASGQNSNNIIAQWQSNGKGNLLAIITDTSGCSDTAKLEVKIGNVGLIELSTLSAFHVYPNPSNGSFTISMQAKNATAVEMRLVNLLSQTVWSQTNILQAGENELTANAPLAPGMYTLIVDENNNRLQQKIVIK